MKRKLLLGVVVGLVCTASACQAADVPKAGDKVWAQWKPNAWYPGKATKRVPVGLHIVFDDGDEADVPIPLIAIDQTPRRGEVKVGTHLLGLWTDNRFYLGTIARIEKGTYSVQFDDGDTRDVKLDELRVLPLEMLPARTAKVDDKVWAQWKPNAWYPGKATKRSPVGLHIVFDDGDEADLSVALIAIDQGPRKGEVKVGTHLLGLWTDSRFYPGTITKIDGDTYSVQFDDGDTRDVGLGDLRLLNE